jgi:hypothetical protein
MHTIRVVNASHKYCINKYMNIKLKLVNCNANVYFNRTCSELNLTPKYVHTKINLNNKTYAKHIEEKEDRENCYTPGTASIHYIKNLNIPPIYIQHKKDMRNNELCLTCLIGNFLKKQHDLES